MSISIVLDPSLVAVPISASSEEEAVAIFGKILHWARIVVQTGAVEIGMVTNRVEILQRADCFPSYPNVEAMLELLNLKHVYSVKDIQRSVNLILDRCRSLTETLGVEVTETRDCKIDETAACCGNGPLRSVEDAQVLAEGLCCSAASIAEAHLRGSKHLGLSVLVTGCFRGKQETHANLVAIERLIRRANGALDLDHEVKKIDVPVRTEDDYFEMLGRTEPALVWKAALNGLHIHLAITLEALRIFKSMAPGARLQDIPRFRVGSEMFASLQRNGAAGNGASGATVRESCARIVLGEPKNELRQFGRVRADGRDALRTHIGKRHEALRLMLWESPHAGVEFANVGPKHEEVIHDGLPNGAVTDSCGSYF